MDSARFLEPILSYGTSPAGTAVSFPSFSLPSRTPKVHNSHHWADLAHTEYTCNTRDGETDAIRRAARYRMVRIVRANVEDVPEIKQVLSETWHATYSSFLSQATINTVTSVWHSADRLAAEIQNPLIFFSVAKTGDGTIIGLTTVGQISDDTVVLSRLYVHPQYQRQGIGSQLLQAGITAFPGARTIRLEVEENNHSAYTFYHNHCFRETESKEERVVRDIIKVLVMEKHIA